MTDPTWPASGLFNVTPSDSTVFAREVRMLYVGTGGDVSLTTQSGDTVVFKNVPNGGALGPFFLTKVNATNTTASDIIGYF